MSVLRVGQSGRYVGQATVGGPADAAAAYQPVSFIKAAPQYTTAREFAGYAVAFGALAALLSGTPQQAGAAEYTVGTHQAAIAAAQPQPKVWGFSPPPVVVADVARPIIVEPQEYSNLAAYIARAKPGDVGFERFIVAAPEHVNSGVAKVFGTPVSVPRPLLKTILVPPQQADDPYGKLWGPEPSPIDNPIGRLLFASPQQSDDAYALLWGPTPQPLAGTDEIGAAEYTFGLHQVAIADAQPKPKVWGPVPAPLADSPLGKWIFAAPEQVESGDTWIWSTTSEAEVVPPDAATFQTPAGKGKGKHKRKYIVDIDGHDFYFDTMAAAIAFLNKAEEVARTAAEKKADSTVTDSLPKALSLGKAEKVKVKAPSITGSAALKDEIAQTRAAIRQIYRDAAITAELRILMALEAERDDEEALLLSL